MAFEFEILNFFQELHTPVLTWIMRAASRLGAVSYTHLDVYKRQQEDYWNIRLVL